MNAIGARATLRRNALAAKDITARMESKAISGAQALKELDALESSNIEAQRDLDVARKAARFAGGADPGHMGGPAYPPGGVAASTVLGLTGEQTKSLFDAAQARMPFAVKAAGDPITSGDVGPAGVPMQALPPVAFGREPTRVASLLMTSATDRPSVEYYVSTGTHGAGPVAEGAEKPETGITYDRHTVTATKIAFRAKATEEALSDYQPFLAMLTGDMTNGIIDAENAALLTAVQTTTAAPTPWGFSGLLAAMGTLAVTPASSGDTVLDGIEEATEVLRVGPRFAEANALVMHPSLFSQARRLKTSFNSYVAGDPLSDGPRTLWGLPTTVTTQMPTNKVIVADFRQAAMLWMRSGLSVRLNPYEGWETNEIGVICEERLALGVTAPGAIAILTMPTPAPPAP